MTRVNWRWIPRRIKHALVCRGEWRASDWGDSACRKCGVWRWWLILPRTDGDTR